MHDLESVDLRLSGESNEKIRRANWAVMEAIHSFKGHESAESPALLGMSEAAFRHVLGLSVSERQRLGSSGIPIWTTCVDVELDRVSPTSVVALSVNQEAELERWAAGATGISINEIRKANRAVLEAVLSFRSREDPAATFLLGLQPKVLEGLLQLRSRDVQKVCLGNIPIWKVRFELAPFVNGKGQTKPALSGEHMMRTLMKELGAN